VGGDETVVFRSGAVELAGSLRLPANLRPGERRPAIVIMHGFGGHRDGPQQRWSTRRFAEWGYVTLRFDFRGCGESGGARGRVIPEEEIEDARSAVTYMAARPEVDPARIALSGTSYGGLAAVGAAGADARVAAVIAQGGWASGERMFRTLHATPAAWARFTDMIERGRRHRRETGQPLMVHRWDIIPVPDALRHNIDPRSIFAFPTDTAETTLAFSVEDAVAKIAPRPLFLMHSAEDPVIAARNSWDLFARAGQPCDIYVVSGVDHFMFGADDPRVVDAVRDWLARYLPVR
jgi:dipeptidyl aminopeptidase/acylaminoacyl peptidase